MTKLKARPTTYKGIQMRSRLEAGFAAWLDKGKVKWNYEPRAFASEDGQYLPDFELPEISVLGQPTQVFIEVKPFFPDLDMLLAQRAIIRTSEPDAQLIAVWPDENDYGPELGTMLVYEDSDAVIDWTFRPEGLALEMTVPACCGPWYGEYWKPRPS